jgi:CheY-like chemotaxis protein
MPQPSGQGPLVLLVEDDRDSREMYAVALGLAGFRVVEAGTAADATRVAHARRPDVIVSDLSLPDRDGCDLMMELHQDTGSGGVPTIALTGRSTEDDIDRCTAAGCSRVLVKPCAPEALAETITEVLADQGNRRHTPPA